MSALISFMGIILKKIHSIYVKYLTKNISKELGSGNRIVAYPYSILGVNNILMEEPINIGPNSTIYTTSAKLIIKRHFIAGPNLTIITGDHYSIVGKFMDEVCEYEKSPNSDQDVIIEEDVWCGANVTILKGVVIGRGSIIAAGAVVTKSCPPYSIIGGVPARVLKYRFTKEQIVEHESKLKIGEK